MYIKIGVTVQKLYVNIHEKKITYIYQNWDIRSKIKRFEKKIIYQNLSNPSDIMQ